MMWKHVLSIALISVLTACAGKNLHQAREIEPQGTKFQQSLHSEYLDLAEEEVQEGQLADADFYAARAVKAGSAQRVHPYTVDANGLPEQTVPVFKKAKTRLGSALDKGARKKAPYRTAKAQAGYDCWLHEIESTAEQDRIDACWAQYQTSIKEVEEILSQ